MLFSNYSYSQEIIKSLMSYPQKISIISTTFVTKDFLTKIVLISFGMKILEKVLLEIIILLIHYGLVVEMMVIFGNMILMAQMGLCREIPYLLESESAENGWMIFDADGSNEIYLYQHT